MNEPKLIKIGDRDSWYENMGERIPKDPKDYPFVGLLEWVEYMIESKID